MLIRNYEENDLAAIQKIHADQGFSYPFPDLHDPLFLEKLILQNDAPGKGIAAAALLRLTAEAYLLIDPGSGSPRKRWQTILQMHEAMRQQALARGLQDVHAWLPPPIAKKFGRRLTRLGWQRDDTWTPYCLRLI